MLNKSKTIIYSGNHGQAAYCQLRIALSKNPVRPKVFVLLSHERDYKGTLVVNNPFSCDHAVNKVFKEDLEGLNIYDVRVFYQCNQDPENILIHKIPLRFSWNPRLTWWDKIRLKLGYRLKFHPSFEDAKCGNCNVSTGVNFPVEKDDVIEVMRSFNIGAAVCKTDVEQAKRGLELD